MVHKRLLGFVDFYDLALGLEQSIDHLNIFVTQFSLSELFKALIFVYDSFSLTDDGT